MKAIMISGAALIGLAACAGPVPDGFDGNTSRVGNTATLVIPSVPQPQPEPVPAPAPVRTISLDGPASSPTPRPSISGMQPPPVEVGVVGPVPDEIPDFPPLVMDEDVEG